jgi:hypothetical protein
LKPKLTYNTGRNPHEDFSEDEVNSRYPNIPQIVKATRIWRSKKIFNGLHHPEDNKGIDHWLIEDTPLVVHRHLKRF